MVLNFLKSFISNDNQIQLTSNKYIILVILEIKLLYQVLNNYSKYFYFKLKLPFKNLHLILFRQKYLQHLHIILKSNKAFLVLFIYNFVLFLF